MREGFQSVGLVDELPSGKSKVVMVNNRETAAAIAWGVMMCWWKERRFLSGLGENHEYDIRPRL